MIVFPESKRYVPSLEQARAANEPQMYSDPGATMEQRFAGYSATTPRVEKFMDLLNLVVGGGEALAQKAEQKVVSLAAMRTAGEGTSFVAESELSKGLKDILKHRRLAGKAANYSELPPEFQQMYSTALGKGPVATSRYKEIFEAARLGDEEALRDLTGLVAIRRQYAADAMAEANAMADFYGEIPAGLEQRISSVGMRPQANTSGTFDPVTSAVQVSPKVGSDIREVIETLAHEIAGHGTSNYLTEVAARNPESALGKLKGMWTRLHSSARALRIESKPMLDAAKEEGNYVSNLALKRISDVRHTLYKSSPEEVFADTIELYMGSSGVDFRTAVRQAAQDVNNLLYNSYNEMVKAKEALGLTTEIQY